jgi:hypothetical protein
MTIEQEQVQVTPANIVQDARAGRMTAEAAEQALRDLNLDPEELPVQIGLANEAAERFLDDGSRMGFHPNRTMLLNPGTGAALFSMDGWQDWETLDAVFSHMASIGVIEVEVAEQMARCASRYVVARRELKPQVSGAPEPPSKFPKRDRLPSNLVCSSSVDPTHGTAEEVDWMDEAAAVVWEATDPIVTKTEAIARKARTKTFAELKAMALNLPQRPPLDANLWPTIAMNEYVDFAKIMAGGCPPKDFSCWNSAWFAFKKAVLRIYPHRQREFDEYYGFVNNLFMSKITDHPSRFGAWLALEAGCRQLVASSSGMGLHQPDNFRPLVESMHSACAAIDAQELAPRYGSSKIPPSKASTSNSDICRKFNFQHCTGCRNKHVCIVCRGPHKKADCDANGAKPAKPTKQAPSESA